MIELVSNWLKPIIILVLIATFMDLLLPNNAMERYVKLVMGLLIILAILSPLFQFLKQDLELSSLTWEQTSAGKGASLETIRTQGKAMEKQRERLVEEEVEKRMAVSIREDVEKNFPVEVTGTRVETKAAKGKDPSLVKLSLVYRPREGVFPPDRRPSVEDVEPVSVELESGREAAKEQAPAGKEGDALSLRIRRHLSETWRLQPGHIKVTPEPGP